MRQGSYSALSSWGSIMHPNMRVRVPLPTSAYYCPQLCEHMSCSTCPKVFRYLPGEWGCEPCTVGGSRCFPAAGSPTEASSSGGMAELELQTVHSRPGAAMSCWGHRSLCKTCALAGARLQVKSRQQQQQQSLRDRSWIRLEKPSQQLKKSHVDMQEQHAHAMDSTLSMIELDEDDMALPGSANEHIHVQTAADEVPGIWGMEPMGRMSIASSSVTKDVPSSSLRDSSGDITFVVTDEYTLEELPRHASPASGSWKASSDDRTPERVLSVEVHDTGSFTFPSHNLPAGAVLSPTLFSAGSSRRSNAPEAKEPEESDGSRQLFVTDSSGSTGAQAEDPAQASSVGPGPFNEMISLEDQMATTVTDTAAVPEYVMVPAGEAGGAVAVDGRQQSYPMQEWAASVASDSSLQEVVLEGFDSVPLTPTGRPKQRLGKRASVSRDVSKCFRQ